MKAVLLSCLCGETLSRFGPDIDGLPTLEWACGHTWGSLGYEHGWQRLEDFAVRDFYIKAAI